MFLSYLEHHKITSQKKLKQIYRIFKQALPKTTLTLSYQMPTLKGKTNLVHFALYDHHIGIYPGPKGIDYLATIAPLSQRTKGAWRIPLETPLPVQTLTKLANWIALSI